MAKNPIPDIWAAGGVVLRKTDGAREVLVIHRPKYDDWTLPKGKLDDGETLKQCALREVLEETGVHCQTGKKLGDIDYRIGSGRLKRVRYWRMKAVESMAWEPNGEVDKVRWVLVSRAPKLLSYDFDREVLARAV